jgi:hypothetical protein
LQVVDFRGGNPNTFTPRQDAAVQAAIRARAERIAGEVFIPNATPTVFVSWQTLGGPAAGLEVDHYDIALRPGTSMHAYIAALQRALGP